MIAGKIPYWAVLPAGMTLEAYNATVDQVSKKDAAGVEADLYEDFGCLSAIDKRECPEALLWQADKVSQNPVLSLINASLIAGFHLAGEDRMLPCNQVKSGYLAGLPGMVPAALLRPVFEKGLGVYKQMKDDAGLELLRECIFLHLCGFPLVSVPGEESPEGVLLVEILNQWEWAPEKNKKFQSYQDWPEEEKFRYDITILNRILMLHKQVSCHENRAEACFEGRRDDHSKIKHRLSSRYVQKPEKSPGCSSFLRAVAPFHGFSIRYNGPDKDTWSIYLLPDRAEDSAGARLFNTNEFTHMVCWIIFNRLCQDGKMPGLTAAENAHQGIRPKELYLFMEKARAFLDNPGENDNAYLAPSVWEKMIVILDVRENRKGQPYESGQIVLKNTWGALYHLTADLGTIENNLLKCYNIAEIIWKFMQEASAVLPFMVILQGKGDEAYARKTIEGFIRQFHQENGKSLRSEKENPSDPEPAPDMMDRPFLDVF